MVRANTSISKFITKIINDITAIGTYKASMNQLAHTLNMSYNLSLEFKEIYRRLK